MQNDRTSRSQPRRAKQRFWTNAGASAPAPIICSRCHSPTLLTPRSLVRPAARSFTIAAQTSASSSVQRELGEGLGPVFLPGGAVEEVGTAGAHASYS